MQQAGIEIQGVSLPGKGGGQDGAGCLGLARQARLFPTAEACVEPQISPSYYTTSDAVISTETVFIVELSLTCKNRAQVSPKQEAGPVVA